MINYKKNLISRKSLLLSAFSTFMLVAILLVVFVSCSSSPESELSASGIPVNIRKFASDYRITYPVLFDGPGDVFRMFGIEAIPHTFVLNSRGQVMYDQLGQMSGKQLTAVIETAIAEDKTELSSATVDFTLPDLEGKDVAIKDYLGKIVVLNFWATWCPPCKAEIPDFVELYENYKDKNVIIIGIANS